MTRKAERPSLPTPTQRAAEDPAYRVLRDQRRSAFGAAVRALRLQDGLAQADLAAQTGLHRSYIGQVERGEVNVSLDNMWAIADGLDVALAELVAPEPF